MKNKKVTPPPFLTVQGNTITGISNTTREPDYFNDMCEISGLIATCNACDRIIFKDENFMEEYGTNGGYCKECAQEITDEEEKDRIALPLHEFTMQGAKVIMIEEPEEPARPETGSQAIVAIGYGANLIPYQNLHFRVKCDNYKDFAKCIEIIESYNNYDAYIMLPELQKYLDIKKWYSVGNPNNATDFFSFEIGREYSPVFYVSYNPKFDKFILIDNKITPYSIDIFKESMQDLKELIQADEMTITEEDYQVTARFWFD